MAMNEFANEPGKPSGDQLFVSLYELLTGRYAGQSNQERYSPAVLATAIEQDGIYGWDRFGRYKLFSKVNAEAIAALDQLAQQYLWSSGHDNQPEDRSPVEMVDDFPQDPHSLYMGWTSAYLPRLEEIKRSIEGNKNPVPPTGRLTGGTAKGINFDRMLIGALVRFIGGKVSQHSHPDFKDIKSLARLIDEKFAGVAGRADSLQKKFKCIADQLENAEREVEEAAGDAR